MAIDGTALRQMSIIIGQGRLPFPRIDAIAFARNDRFQFLACGFIFALLLERPVRLATQPAGVPGARFAEI